MGWEPRLPAGAHVFTDRTTAALELGLDALALRKRVSADNVANAMTPGFRAQRVAFEDNLAAALRDGQAPQTAAIEVHPSTAPAGADGNNVDLHGEFTGKTGLHFQAAVEALNYKLRLLKTAAR